MGSYIARQPNGLICRYSSIVDNITHYNMTEEDYINYKMEKARKDAIDTLNRYMQPFDDIIHDLNNPHVSKEVANKLIEAMTEDVSDLKEDNKHKRSKRDSTQKCPYCNKQWNFNRVRRKQYNTKEGLIITCSKCGEKFKVMSRNINKDEGQKPRYEFYGVALKDLE